MFSKINFYKILGIFAGILLLITPTPTFARGNDHHHQKTERHFRPHHYQYGHHRHHHHYPSFGFHLNILPRGCVTVVLGRSRYYYFDGVYYSRWGREYVVVAPPSGVVVRTIPMEYQQVFINGTPYYTSNGIYYVYTNFGYQVVPPPVAVVSSMNTVPVVPSVQTTYSSTPVTPGVGFEDLFTVNIPNAQSGYTAVVLKRTSNGYVGPQGEFYPEFPKVEQLSAMYGK